MSAADFMLLLPWIVLGGGLVVVLVLVGFWRSHGGIAAVTGALLLTTAALALRALHLGITGVPEVVSLVVVDGMALLMVALFAFSGAVVTCLSWRWLREDEGEPEEFYVLLLCAVFGAVTLVAAEHFAIVLLGLETLSIALYTLIAYPQAGARPLEAAIKYLVLSAVATATLLFGAALVFTQTGSLHLDAFGGAGVVPASDPLLRAGSALVLAAIAFKLSLVPFHLWTPDVYEGAPAPVAALVATVSKGAVVILLLRLTLASDLLAGGALFTALGALALLSMLAGNVLALLQRKLTRILAYSSIAHMGYLLVALLAVGGSGGAAQGIEATLVYVVTYTVMTLAAFAVIATLAPVRSASSTQDAVPTLDPDDEEALAGLFWRRPLTATVLTIALLSLAGIPLTAGFMGKFEVVLAGVEQGYWPLLVMLLVGSGIGLFYYLRILRAMVREPEQRQRALAEQGPEGAWVLVTLAGMTLLLGTWPAWLLSLVEASMAP